MAETHARWPAGLEVDMLADGRGSPWEYDPGPAPGSGWAELFAETPNYGGLGRAVLGHEVLRWHFGPMF